MTAAQDLFFKQADKLARIHEKMDSKSERPSLQMLKHLLKAMEVTTKAASLPHAGSAPLFLGLSQIMTGIESDKSATGIVGPALAKVVDALSSGICCSLMPQAGVAERQFLKMLSLTSYVLLISLAARTASKGLSPLPTSSQEKETDGKPLCFFSFELALDLANHTSIVKDIFKIFIESCGGNELAKETGASILAEAGHLLMIMAATAKNKVPVTYLVAEGEKNLRQGIASAALAVRACENQGIVNPAIAVAVGQLQMALDANLELEFIQTFEGMLEDLGTSLNALSQDIWHLERIVSMACDMISHSGDDKSLTGIVNVI